MYIYGGEGYFGYVLFIIMGDFDLNSFGGEYRFSV